MIKIVINKNVGMPGYWMSIINEENMRDVLYLHFDCVHCISAMIDTLTYSTNDEIDLTNYAWKDWEKGTTCNKKPLSSDYTEHRGN